MKRLSKVLITILSMLLLFVLPSVVFAISDDEFSADEDYYKNLCFGIISKENQEVCEDFQGYLDRKIKTQKSEISNLELEIDDIQDNIDQYLGEIEGMEIQIENLQNEIAANEAEVVRMEENIVLLQEQIEKRQLEIEEKDEAIKERMAAQQSSMHTNSQVSFLFGAEDFSDFIRRSSVINTVTNFDQEKIQEITLLRIKLAAEQVEVERQQKLVQETILNIEIQQENLEISKRNVETIVIEYQNQEAELLEAQAMIAKNVEVSQAEQASINQGLDNLQAQLEAERLAAEQAGQDTSNIGVGGGWIHPVNANFRVTAGQWYYPGGGAHYGTDLASYSGAPIVSTGPGVVVKVVNYCPSPSYSNLGDTCGGRYGNHVTTVIQMSDGLYAITYAHLVSAAVSLNDFVLTGLTIGYMGNSGSSSGTHLHYEIRYLGDYELEYYLNSVWNHNTNFTPNGAYMNMSWTCANRGGVAPCRVNAQSLYGYSVGSSY